MSSPDSEEPIDPWEAHFRREPLAGAAVAVILREGDDPALTQQVALSLERLIRGRGRGFELAQIPADLSAAEAIRQGLAATASPLVLVTTAQQPWTAAHVEPMLKAINASDHVLGRRKTREGGGFRHFLARMVWRGVFAAPGVDTHSPCRIHRRDRLAALPLQSGSDFVDVEIMAKATFLGHLVDEVEVPPLDSPRPRVDWADVRLLLKQPVFVPRSGPPEDPKSDPESDDGPEAENPDRGGDVEPARAFKDDRPEGVEELRQGEGLDQGLDGVGEPLGREKDA